MVSFEYVGNLFCLYKSYIRSWGFRYQIPVCVFKNIFLCWWRCAVSGNGKGMNQKVAEGQFVGQMHEIIL